MLVFAQVSSMKINRAAGILFWCRFHCRRRRATSARSCSLACRLFFKAETNVVNEMPDTVIADLNTALVQLRQQFASGDIRLLFNTSPYPCLFTGQREGLFAAHRQRRRTARFGLASGPADRRGVAHLIMRRRSLPAHAGGDGGDNAFAQIERIWSCHAGWPPVQPVS